MICYRPSPWSKRIKNTFKSLVKITKTSINKKNKSRLKHSLLLNKTKSFKKSLPLFKSNMIKLSKLTNKNIPNFLSWENKNNKKVKYNSKTNKKFKNFKKHVKNKKLSVKNLKRSKKRKINFHWAQKDSIRKISLIKLKIARKIIAYKETVIN